MLRLLFLENFKCFTTKTVIEARPLTLLVGKNQQGKSTVFDALAIIAASVSGKADLSNVGWNKLNDSISYSFGINWNKIHEEEGYASRNKELIDFNFYCLKKDFSTDLISLKSPFLHLFDKQNRYEKAVQLFNQMKYSAVNTLCLLKPSKKATFISQVKEWLQFIFDDINLLPPEENSFPQGSGYQNVFSILVGGLAAKDGDILAIEHPENCLTPEAQGRLFYFLTALSRANVQVFVETHSPHIIDGVTKQILENNLDDRNVMILHFDLARIHPVESVSLKRSLIAFKC